MSSSGPCGPRYHGNLLAFESGYLNGVGLAS